MFEDTWEKIEKAMADYNTTVGENGVLGELSTAADNLITVIGDENSGLIKA
jgi:hypothetical protein